MHWNENRKHVERFSIFLRFRNQPNFPNTNPTKRSQSDDDDCPKLFIENYIESNLCFVVIVVVVRQQRPLLFLRACMSAINAARASSVCICVCGKQSSEHMGFVIVLKIVSYRCSPCARHILACAAD